MKAFESKEIRILKGCLPEDTSWWTEEDWNRHKEYVEELQASGEYLKEETIIVTYIPHPIFDSPRSIPEGSSFNSKFVFLNFKDGEVDDTLR